MRTRISNISAVVLAALFLFACVAEKTAPHHPQPAPESPNGEYLVRTAAAELHIISPGGEISIDQLEISNSKSPLTAQTDANKCPFPTQATTPAPAADRETGPAAASSSGGDVGSKAVGDQAERIDAAAAGEYREPENPGRTLEVPKRK